MADKPKRKLKTDEKPKNETSGNPIAAVIVGFVAVTLVLAGLFVIANVEVNEEVTVVAETSTTAVEPDEDSMAARPPYDRGVFYLSEGRFLAAADAFTAAIEENFDNAEARYGRARAYHDAGMFEAALEDYNRLLSDHPDYDYSAWIALADLYWEQYQRTDEAVHLPDALAAAEQAITLMERQGDAQPDAYRLAGMVEDQLGNADTALRYYEDYLEAAPVPSPAIQSRVAELQRQ